MPVERRSRIQFANHLADLISKDGNKLVEVQASPQARKEEWETLAGLRSRLGTEDPVLDSPGHLFKSADRNAFRTMLSTLMGFGNGWSFYIYSAPSRNTLLINGRVEIWSPKKGLRNELSRHLATRQAA